ncbi:hypothetical protein H6P81_006372 [Aristolochia fimbriata]|uniref:Uncharacterized protein n=1 Tax=Aristolochia fimbriata TaxID=158543 RepID=A0AAV7F1N9_ARIFI|nr:hypothetical protein H6P81_006372 [Aristolochia fimbriata]
MLVSGHTFCLFRSGLHGCRFGSTKTNSHETCRAAKCGLKYFLVNKQNGEARQMCGVDMGDDSSVWHCTLQAPLCLKGPESSESLNACLPWHPQLTATSSFPPPPPPPPTPSNQTLSSAAPDALSRLLLRLPPTLSLPPRRRPSQANTVAALPVVSLAHNHSPHDDLVSQPGYFQLIHHHVPSQLAEAAELQAESLFLGRDPNHPNQLPWPHGYDEEEDEYGESFCFDPTAASDSDTITSLCELAALLEGIGFEVVEALSNAVGFENPFKEKSSKASRLLWVSKSGGDGNSTAYYSARLYPYVWSNGKLKKVKGRPVINHGEESAESSAILITLLLSLPLDSVVSPLPILMAADKEEESRDDEEEEEEEEACDDNRFASFSFEDYAWRVYHERLPRKDTLQRYRI